MVGCLYDTTVWIHDGLPVQHQFMGEVSVWRYCSRLVVCVTLSVHNGWLIFILSGAVLANTSNAAYCNSEKILARIRMYGWTKYESWLWNVMLNGREHAICHLFQSEFGGICEWKTKTLSKKIFRMWAMRMNHLLMKTSINSNTNLTLLVWVVKMSNVNVLTQILPIWRKRLFPGVMILEALACLHDRPFLFVYWFVCLFLIKEKKSPDAAFSPCPWLPVCFADVDMKHHYTCHVG